jgi:hypothetical protein
VVAPVPFSPLLREGRREGGREGGREGKGEYLSRRRRDFLLVPSLLP